MKLQESNYYSYKQTKTRPYLQSKIFIQKLPSLPQSLLKDYTKINLNHLKTIQSTRKHQPIINNTSFNKSKLTIITAQKHQQSPLTNRLDYQKKIKSKANTIVHNLLELTENPVKRPRLMIHNYMNQSDKKNEDFSIDSKELTRSLDMKPRNKQILINKTEAKTIETEYYNNINELGNYNELRMKYRTLTKHPIKCDKKLISTIESEFDIQTQKKENFHYKQFPVLSRNMQKPLFNNNQEEFRLFCKKNSDHYLTFDSHADKTINQSIKLLDDLKKSSAQVAIRKHFLFNSLPKKRIKRSKS